MIDLADHRIMAVDDEPDNLSVLKATLEMINNSNVFIAASCEEAMRNLSSYNPTVILTDLSMPKEDGYALLYKVRHHADYGKLPIIALTAHAMQGDRERILAAGFDGYISKPFNILTVGDEIVALLTDIQVKSSQRLEPITPPTLTSPNGSTAGATDGALPVAPTTSTPPSASIATAEKPTESPVDQPTKPSSETSAPSSTKSPSA